MSDAFVKISLVASLVGPLAIFPACGVADPEGSSAASSAPGAETDVELAPPERCEVPGDEAIDAALSHGFGFAIDKTEGSVGSCIDHLPTVIAAASEDGPGIGCHITYFGDRELHPDWKLVDVVFRGRFDWLEQPRFGTSVPQFSVALSAETGENPQLRLVRIELQGPSCENWKSAFSPGQR
jgi:hypothetical protein